MSQESVLRTKSFAFAVRIINLSKYLKVEQREYLMSQQVLKSGTAIGALVREAEFAESPQDFMHKLAIGLKEANETVYWLLLLKATSFITERMFDSLFSEARELISMLVASINTIKRKKNFSKRS